MSFLDSLLSVTLDVMNTAHSSGYFGVTKELLHCSDIHTIEEPLGRPKMVEIMEASNPLESTVVSAFLKMSIPDTSVTVYSEHIGNTFAAKGISIGSILLR